MLGPDDLRAEVTKAKTAPARGMGRGLAAILSVSDGASEGDQLRDLAVELIVPNPHQPRATFEEDALQALADSIRANGILQPVLVRPLAGGTFELVAGERRWRAAKLAGLDRVPALVRDRDDAASLELALVENMAREDLNPIEEARACAALVEELGLTREDVGRRVGRSRVAVSNLLRLLDLPDEAIELLGLPHREIALDDLLRQGLRVGRGDERPRVTGGQLAGTHELEHGLRQRQEPQQVGDVAPALAESLGQPLLGVAEAVHQLAIALRLLERVEVGALDVLDDGELQHLGVVEVSEDRRQRVDAGELRRPPAPLAGDDLVLA